MDSHEIKNKNTYLSRAIVDFYDKFEGLQPPETTMFEILKPRLSGMRMLDVGVGGGRTTTVFAPLVKSYTAIDYSEAMVERCKAKFSERYPQARFLVSDAATLSEFNPSEFDFVLFSFNGVDHMPIESRIAFLRRARMLLRPNGVLWFSTHNISYLRHMTVRAVFRLQWNMGLVVKKLLRRMKIRRVNALAFKNANTSDFAFVNDGTHDFALDLCYVRTSFQLKLLNDAGFSRVRVFAFNTGREYLGKEAILAAEDPWLHYLCE